MADVRARIVLCRRIEDAPKGRPAPPPLARREGALVNIVEQIFTEQRLYPRLAIRGPVTRGPWPSHRSAAPVLARAIKADLEERLPATWHAAAFGKRFSASADRPALWRSARDFMAGLIYSWLAGTPRRGGDGKTAREKRAEARCSRHQSRDRTRRSHCL